MVPVSGTIFSKDRGTWYHKIGVPYWYWTTGCPKRIVPHLCGYCGEAVDSIILIFTQLHRSGFNLEFLRPCFSQSDTWLLIYGREKAK